ncbi:CYTH domain-containing protein [Magnetococcales bacterium HHB-1]
MGQEIERKYLVRGEGWRKETKAQQICQGFFHTLHGHTVRVRAMDQQGYVTFKSGKEKLVRAEYEYKIPLEEAREMLDKLCDQPFIKKTRHDLIYEGKTWSVDEFYGVNEGLILAEVELEHENEPLILPPWIDLEVTGKPCFYNLYLAMHPYVTWCRDPQCIGHCGRIHPEGLF